MESSDDEDARKPAARPSAVTVKPVQQHDESSTTTKSVVLPVTGELPFLVTRWLSGFTGGDEAQGATEEQQAAFAKIHKAAADLASAFTALGAFGIAVRPSLGLVTAANPMHSTASQHGSTHNTTYADMKRAWHSCGKDQLDLLLQSTQSMAAAVDATVKKNAPENHLQASAEILVNVVRNNASGGRTLQDAILVTDESSNNVDSPSDLSKDSNAAVSALQAPVLLVKKAEEIGETGAASSSTLGEPSLTLSSSVAELAAAAANSMRRYLETRMKCHAEVSHIRSLQRSLQHQQDTLVKLDQERSKMLALNGMHGTVRGANPSTLVLQLDEIKTAEQNCKRVIAQLQRQLPFLERTHEMDSQEHLVSRVQATKDFTELRDILQNYRDPVASSRRPTFLNNRILMNICNRQLGIDRFLARGIPRAMGRIRAIGATLENRKALLYNRFSHAATVNTHLSYPVYCLRFDRTGRYFITGADDYLVKVFCVGGSVVVKKNGRIDPTGYARGAVLVCTLKGHAGVINDIGVSSDNSFLATASEDGDCRVWGLKDGCPVAILRGHAGGANMVSWSTLTPYRLVTTGADGLARTWDVREACLKRYSYMIGKRPEYHLRVNGKDLSLIDDATLFHHQNLDEAVPVPPLPVRVDNSESVEAVPAVLEPPVPPPPIPLPAAEVANQAANGNADNADEIAGRFVANDVIDEGVKLVSKLQHGATLEERSGGPGTRARRSAVKVICVARCPYGGHFATGSDDGICRVWLEEDNSVVERVDAHFDPSSTSRSTEKVDVTRAARYTAANRLLLTLNGHLSAITDLQYSKRGDRILTGSQKDGVVRIWSWSADPVNLASTLDPPTQHQENIKTSHILLKLTNPNSSASIEVRQGPRARSNRSLTMTIACDVAVWIHDDSKIVTSQSELSKQSGNEIIAGSQYLFLWDSVNGHCLLGIPGAHSMACPVVIPHPVVSSIICSAGADGFVKLWDWETGKCFFSHRNTADFGPIEPSERGKSFGYLDGDFSPDGTILVLTDDSGRVTVLDSSVARANIERANEASTVIAFPDWMKEQYFSNDYYDLFYDANGYCVERGSERPPHLAPRGARCSHSGTPFSVQVNETFQGLSGPIPTCESTARWHRQQIREIASRMQERRVTIQGNLVRQYDPTTTTLVQHGGKATAQPKPSNAAAPSDSLAASRSRTGSTHHLSSNFRWGEYNDMEFGDDEQDRESDDEDFELNESRSGAQRSRGVEDSESEDLEVDDEEDMAISRTTKRHVHWSSVDNEDLSGDEYDEFVSTNNTPSGPFVADYDAHFFRMPPTRHVNRLWLRRNESSSSYGGRKKYTPQVGDSVVYIPRAHHDTLAEFPGVQTPPWQHWPDEAAWPVVRCCIRNIRYRFPYKDYKHCFSVVAKLALEVTGIPELSSEPVFGWPSPSFTTPTRSHVFELSVFENEEDDFIVPVGLFMSRLRQLECALSDSDRDVKVAAFYADSRDNSEDAEYVSFLGRVVRYSGNFDADMNHPNMYGSGFRSLCIIWDEGPDNGPDQVSPWDVSVQAPVRHVEAPERPKLNEDEKTRVRDALNTIRSLPRVDEFFLLPVDIAKYSDYTLRVEVPMDLTFMMNRLEADYYATRSSAVADVQLIYYNCKKYNGEKDELSDLAGLMLEKFEEQVLNEEERSVFHKYDSPFAGVQPTASLARSEAQPNSVVRASAVQRRSKRRVPERSALENLPAPAEPVRAQSRRGGRITQPANRRSSVRQGMARDARSVLEVAQPETVRTLEQLSSGHGQRARGRATRSATSAARASSFSTSNQNGGQVHGQAREMPRRAASVGLRNSAYAEVPSDVDETEHVGQAVSTRGSRRSVASEERRSSRTDHVVRSRAQMPARRAAAEARNSLAEVTGLEEESGLERRITRGRQVSTTVASSRPSRHPSRTSSGPSFDVDAVTNAVDGRREHSASTESADDSEADMEQSVTLKRGSSRRSYGFERNDFVRSRRSARSSAAATADHGSDPDDDEAFPERVRRSTRARLPEAAEKSSSGETQSDDESDFEGLGASSESGEDLSVQSSDSESRVPATRGARSRPSRSRFARDEDEPSANERKRKSTRTRGLSRAVRVPDSYHDPSLSEVGSDVSSEPPAVRRKRQKKPIAKKRNATSSTGKPTKKIKTEVKEATQSLELAKWPEVPMQRISEVTKGVLGVLRSLDDDGVFAAPVVEAYPELTASYLERISHPMDFRTIEENRLLYYKSITELQDDLILVFSNCMNYNEPGSPLYDTASSMMGLLEDSLRTVCDSLGVRLLHHRSP